ncbi:hypothetical protein SDC9_190711 [bioreactor metagenome]|uniref:Uncharacterized protein n=1 Tax=bioreactor metagenome TaxID=1076179 RepID=A0A645HXC2_9ZZZZ
MSLLDQGVPDLVDRRLQLHGLDLDLERLLERSGVPILQFDVHLLDLFEFLQLRDLVFQALLE